MLPTHLSPSSVSDIEEGFSRLETENDQCMVPLRQLISGGKALSGAYETFIDDAGNMIDELLVVEKINSIGSVPEASKTFGRRELKTLELLILKYQNTTIVDKSAAKACKPPHFPLIISLQPLFC